jgi:molecular chaperone GrpE (heat shock protein)
VSITVRILDKILKKNGVVEIDCLNKKFDPNLAEALV